MAVPTYGGPEPATLPLQALPQISITGSRCVLVMVHLSQILDLPLSRSTLEKVKSELWAND